MNTYQLTSTLPMKYGWGLDSTDRSKAVVLVLILFL